MILLSYFKFLFTLILFVVFVQSASALKPDREYYYTPDSVDWVYDQIVISTKDHFKLNTWVYFPDSLLDKKTVLVLAYPDAGNMSYYVHFAWMMAKSGYTVITFDYRGFGKSDDFEINPDQLYYTEFSTDLTSIVGFASREFNNHKIGIWALSMGTIVTTRAYPSISDKVDFIIGEGFVTDTARILERYKQKGKKLILPESSEKYQYQISKINIPILIFVASEDEITSTTDAMELNQSHHSKFKVMEYKGQHLRGFQYLIEREGFGGWYIHQINDFLAAL